MALVLVPALVLMLAFAFSYVGAFPIEAALEFTR